MRGKRIVIGSVMALLIAVAIAAEAPAVQAKGTKRPCQLRSPTWSPDGTQIAFEAGELMPNVYVVDVDGGAAARCYGAKWVTSVVADGRPDPRHEIPRRSRRPDERQW